MKQTVRTFVAVEIGDAVRDRAEKLIEILGRTDVDVKWVEPQNVHITMKFLGEVALKETPRICDAVKKAAAKVEPFEIEIRGAGAFPNPGKPRTIWLGSGEGDERMRALHKAVESALAKLGFRKDARRFNTHLTIGRVRHGGRDLAELSQLIGQQADFEAGRTKVTELVIFSSDLGPKGPTYAPIGRARLG